SAACASHPAELSLPRTWDDRYLNRGSETPSFRPTLAVLPFVVGNRVGKDADLHVEDMVTTALFKTGRFDMVERERLATILEEQRLGQSGLVDRDSAARIGKLVGAKAVVFGVVSSATQQKFDRFAYDVVRTEVRVDARAVDTSSGRLTFTESAVGTSEARIV